VESGRDGRRADVFLARSKSPIETAPLLPEPWPMPPDIPHWSVIDFADGRCPRALSDVPVRLKLQQSESRAEQAAFVGCVGLSRYPEGVRVAEIGNHGLELRIAVGDVIALPLHLDHLAHHGNRVFDIPRPVGAGLEPPGIFRRIVVLLDRLEE